MKKFVVFLLALGVLLLPIPAFSEQCPGIVNLQGIRPIPGHQELAVSSTAVALTVPSSATAFIVRFAVATVKGNPVVTRDDGTNPTAASGQVWLVGEKFLICQSSLASFRVIRESSDASIGVSYYGN